MPRFLQFRFVPTMRCNLRCEYCFLAHSTGNEPTMFDKHPPAEWVEAFRAYSGDEVEFYCWGGEPFSCAGTYEFIRGIAAYDFVTYGRVDTNMTFARRILELCPSDKVRLNCSWHTHALDFDRLWTDATALAERATARSTRPSSAASALRRSEPLRRPSFSKTDRATEVLSPFSIRRRMNAVMPIFAPIPSSVPSMVPSPAFFRSTKL